MDGIEGTRDQTTGFYVSSALLNQDVKKVQTEQDVMGKGISYSYS